MDDFFKEYNSSSNVKITYINGTVEEYKKVRLDQDETYIYVVSPTKNIVIPAVNVLHAESEDIK